LPLSGLDGSLVERMINETKRNELASQFYLEKIKAEIEDYELSNAAGDPEIYHSRIDGQDSECGYLIDDYKQHKDNKDVLLELDSFLAQNNVSVDKDAKEYKLLYREFLKIKIDVCLKKVEMFETGGYTSNNYDIKQAENQQVPIIKSANKGREERPSTYNKRVIINAIIRRIREGSPYVTQAIIAEDAANEFNKNHSEEFGKKLSPGAILRDYSDEL